MVCISTLFKLYNPRDRPYPTSAADKVLVGVDVKPLCKFAAAIIRVFKCLLEEAAITSQ